MGDSESGSRPSHLSYGLHILRAVSDVRSGARDLVADLPVELCRPRFPGSNRQIRMNTGATDCLLVRPRHPVGCVRDRAGADLRLAHTVATPPTINASIPGSATTTILTTSLARQAGFDFATRYELSKAIWSSRNDGNFFELGGSRTLQETHRWLPAH